MNNKYTIGDILYAKSDNNISFIRIVRIKSNDTCIVMDENKQMYSIKFNDLFEYIKLKPDGYLSVLHLKPDDIAIVLNRSKDLDNKISEPYLICRQNALNIFMNAASIINTDLYVGCSITKDNCPVGINYKMLLSCDKIYSKVMISIYNTDTVDDILSMIPKINKYNQVLEDIYNTNEKLRYIGKSRYIGYSKSIKELLENCSFKEDLYSSFDILYFPIEFDINENNTLDPKYIRLIESKSKTEMFKVNIFKYNRSINTNKINRKFMLIADKTDTVYIVIYDAGSYINREYQEIGNKNPDIMSVNIKDL